jgi:uncharacterized protein YjiK
MGTHSEILRKTYLTLNFRIVIISVFSIVLISVSFCGSSSGKNRIEKRNESTSSEPDSASVLSSDSSNPEVATSSDTRDSFPYDLEHPDEMYSMPGYLREISGIAFYRNDMILCEQDQNASIYIFDLKRKEITDKFKFGKDGDYEDIAVIGETAYVLRSDGNIFEVENFEKEKRKVTEYKTPLSGVNNTEGLTYDKLSNSLLVACKGSPAIANENPHSGYKAIYRFDLEKMKLKKEPEFLININRPDSYKDDNFFKEYSLSISKKYFLSVRDTEIHPSGLAIHPVKNEIYLISSVGKFLVVLDMNGKILDLHHLDDRIFRQPEGICFSPSGDLFISSEGQSGNGYILKFNLRKNQ